MMTENFYHAFEERYRGSRETIKLRLRFYLPFVKLLRNFYSDPKAVDLGCGRGEWLELLQEADFDAQGVDIDNVQLAVCKKLGFNVSLAEAVSFLKGLPSESQVIVSGFHIVEHILFPDIQSLVQEALRVLKPGGLLFLETPNPENIVVGTAKFYIDPMHQRPIPSQLLSFLSEYYGFKRVKIMGLQESVERSENKMPTLLEVLNGVSRDYAVIAQKAGEEETMVGTNSIFEEEYGLTLDNLATRYDEGMQRVEERTQQAEEKIRQTGAIVSQFVWENCKRTNLFIVWISWLFRKSSKPQLKDVFAAYRYFLGREPEDESAALSYRRVRTISELFKIFQCSEEFRMRKQQHIFFSSIKKLLRYFFILVFNFLCNHPVFKNKIRNLIARYPAVDVRLRKIVKNRKLVMEQKQEIIQLTWIDLTLLTPLEQTIYDNLKKKT